MGDEIPANSNNANNGIARNGSMPPSTARDDATYDAVDNNDVVEEISIETDTGIEDAVRRRHVGAAEQDISVQ